jgi:hypothetical protein
MKRFFIVLSASVLLFSSCGGENAEAVEVSPEMKGFMEMLTGDDVAVEKALDKYALESTSREDMDMYSLESPEVTSAKDNCYHMDAKAGMTVRTYEICWEEGKISKIVDKGFK